MQDNYPSKNHENRKDYNWLLYDQSDKFLIEYIPYYKGTMLDLGCADKPFEDFFRQYVDEYIGVDWTNTLHNSKADIVSDLNEKILLDDENAETIVSLNVLEHLCEPQKFLNECHRLLKDDGTLILHIPFQWWIHEQPYDYFRYTPYGLKYMLTKAGFENIHVQPTGGFYTTIFMKINYFSRRFITGSPLKQKIKKLFIKPFWYLSQKLAPYLDNTHRGWSLEAQSFFVVAKKHKKINLSNIKEKVIVSLTSYGKRIHTVHTVLQNMLEQTYQPHKIILWLSQDEFTLDTIPQQLKKLLLNEKIEIKFCPDIKSYKKLIPTLKLFPNDIIITIDDDVHYHKELISQMLNEHIKYPNTVICGRGHKMKFDKNKELLSYNDWDYCSEHFIADNLIFPTGAGGILYPPNSLHSDTTNESLFMKLAPQGDDIWFKTMSLKQGVKSKVMYQSKKEFIKLDFIEDTQEEALCNYNIDEREGNNKQIKQVFQYYSELNKQFFKDK